MAVQKINIWQYGCCIHKLMHPAWDTHTGPIQPDGYMSLQLTVWVDIRADSHFLKSAHAEECDGCLQTSHSISPALKNRRVLEVARPTVLLVFPIRKTTKIIVLDWALQMLLRFVATLSLFNPENWTFVGSYNTAATVREASLWSDSVADY